MQESMVICCELTFCKVYDKISKQLIRASQGFDGVFETGEASRCDTLIANLKLNANNKLAYAA